MTYYSPAGRPASWQPPVAPTTTRTVFATFATLVLGFVTWAFAWVASFVIYFAAGTYDGNAVTQANISAAHHGQIALLVLAVVVGAPWLATAVQRRRGWQLQAVIAVLVTAVPVWGLFTHLAVTSWPQPFTF